MLDRLSSVSGLNVNLLKSVLFILTIKITFYTRKKNIGFLTVKLFSRCLLKAAVKRILRCMGYTVTYRRFGY